MSYYATGGGNIHFIPDFDKNRVEELLADNPFDDWDWDLDGGIDIWQNEKYYDDEYCDVLAKLAPFVESGELEFIGEDQSIWRFVFKDGKFLDESGRVVYPTDEEATQRQIAALKKILNDMSEHIGLADTYSTAIDAGLNDKDLVELGLECLLDVKEVSA